uniref:Uncharacterized protein n=1 Tax=Anguilla anguilla TaxID=7936 RepID=A0A0E9WAA4_ANGAN
MHYNIYFYEKICPRRLCERSFCYISSPLSHGIESDFKMKELELQFKCSENITGFSMVYMSFSLASIA